MNLTGRVLIRLRILSDKKIHTLEELSYKSEIPSSTIRRYINSFKDFGVEIESTRGPYGGYILKKFYYM
ncbi:HTH domain-containing protein [Clostridium chauvoei]|uniref:HTH domain-containing protein n=1 Tax=Clostridium chauvoei TaxID=46867 RepID=UPI001C844304|nr:HTH domain-containing protein [Clostridium chauvoei]MBX7362366.1 HTH domain-containing protein [Clostridium chauvoei]